MEEIKVSQEIAMININKILDIIIITTNEEMIIRNLISQEISLGLIWIEKIDKLTKVKRIKEIDKGEDRDHSLHTMIYTGKRKNFRIIIQIVEIRGKMSRRKFKMRVGFYKKTFKKAKMLN